MIQRSNDEPFPGRTTLLFLIPGVELHLTTASVAPRVGATASLLQCRQISPLVATALLGKLRSKMTTEQQNTVDALKKACPGYAVIPAW